ncbi:Protein MAIN-LIKE 1 [Glycine soja]
MVRTKGLGRALGHVTGRGVGRGDRDDSDDAPQCQWPTASAQRQRVPVTMAHDEPVLPAPDVEVDDTGADIPADTGAQAAEDEHEGFLGGPSDPSMLTQYADHVACSIWTGEECPELKLSSHGRKVHSLGRPVPTIEGLVAGTGLSPLIACSVDTGNRGLLSSFVEWWHRETPSFHLPVGELTITLDDISSILHLPLVGDLHAFQPLHMDDVVQMLVDLLMVSAEAARAETGQCRGPYVCLQWAGHWTAAARVYLLHFLGCTLFANKSATNVHVVYLEALRDLSQTGRYAWGVASLVHMYDQLNDASIRSSRQLGGYITLLAGFTSTFPQSRSPLLIKTTMRIPRMHVDVCWIPYGEHRSVRDFHLISCYFGLLRWGPVVVYYRPERVVRQFGYTQTIPAPPVDSWVSYDDIHDKWMHYSDHIIPAGEPRVVPQAPQTDIPHVLKPGAPSTSARPAMEEPRHAVIAERLERHLNLGVVTPGSSTHEVIEECLRMARSVTQDQLVYVRSRHRRHTDWA